LWASSSRTASTENQLIIRTRGNRVWMLSYMRRISRIAKSTVALAAAWQ